VRLRRTNPRLAVVHVNTEQNARAVLKAGVRATAPS